MKSAWVGNGLMTDIDVINHLANATNRMAQAITPNVAGG